MNIDTTEPFIPRGSSRRTLPVSFIKGHDQDEQLGLPHSVHANWRSELILLMLADVEAGRLGSQRHHLTSCDASIMYRIDMVPTVLRRIGANPFGAYKDGETSSLEEMLECTRIWISCEVYDDLLELDDSEAITTSMVLADIPILDTSFSSVPIEAASPDRPSLSSPTASYISDATFVGSESSFSDSEAKSKTGIKAKAKGVGRRMVGALTRKEKQIATSKKIGIKTDARSMRKIGKTLISRAFLGLSLSSPTRLF